MLSTTTPSDSDSDVQIEAPPPTLANTPTPQSIPELDSKLLDRVRTVIKIELAYRCLLLIRTFFFCFTAPPFDLTCVTGVCTDGANSTSMTWYVSWYYGHEYIRILPGYFLFGIAFGLFLRWFLPVSYGLPLLIFPYLFYSVRCWIIPPRNLWKTLSSGDTGAFLGPTEQLKGLYTVHLWFESFSDVLVLYELLLSKGLNREGGVGTALAELLLSCLAIAQMYGSIRVLNPLLRELQRRERRPPNPVVVMGNMGMDQASVVLPQPMNQMGYHQQQQYDEEEYDYPRQKPYQLRA